MPFCHLPFVLVLLASCFDAFVITFHVTRRGTSCLSVLILRHDCISVASTISTWYIIVNMTFYHLPFYECQPASSDTREIYDDSCPSFIFAEVAICWWSRLQVKSLTLLLK